MEEVLIERIAFWGSASVACLLIAFLLISALAISKRFAKEEPTIAPHKEKDIKIGKAIIRRIDRLDDMIASLRLNSTDETLIRQLKFFRDDLTGLLRNHSIEAFELEKGTLLDSPTLKLVQIVESDQKKKKSRPSNRIAETIRHGYRHQISANDPSTIVRKPLVKVR